MKLTKLYEELKFDDVFKAASPEEVVERKKKYAEIKIKEILDNIKKTKLSDGTWHVHGNLNLSEQYFISLRSLNVSIVDGYFNCSFNKRTSLEGAPKIIKGFFSCAYNQLTSLEYAPKEVGGTFYCNDNKTRFTKDEIIAICYVKGAIVV